MFAAPASLINGGFVPSKKGTIERDSRSGKGTEFPKTLPRPFTSHIPRKESSQGLCVFPLHSPVQEGIAKGIQFPERFLRIHHQGIPGDNALHLSLHHRNEGVRGRLGPNPHAWEILFQQVPGRRERSHDAGILFTDQHRMPTTRQTV